MKLDDVARKAGVSSATVSRVLNDRYGVKKSTRVKVRQAIEALRYQPNFHARTLARGKTHILGVIVSNLHNPFFADVLQTIETDAVQRGYEVLVANTRHDLDLLGMNVRQMLGQRVAGLAAIVSEMDPGTLERLTHSGIRVALYDVGHATENITTIKFDYRRGMKMLVELLYALGHRRMAYVDAPNPLQPTEDRRLEFLEATSQRSVRTQVVAPKLDGFHGGREASREILRTGFAPTAIVCVNDWVAVGVLRELRNQRIQVPHDISVTGFDNVSLSEFACPSLTTIHIPREMVGHLVVESLLPAAGRATSPGRDIAIDPELIVRESTGGPPAPNLPKTGMVKH